ncbi:MAG: outer membrane lipoprotein-sorting protein [Deltaproteobacteria bacterium]|nr:outer membrane lipoprotein-sorting protein [Deltaproteobacteria bacterium]
MDTHKKKALDGVRNLFRVLIVLFFIAGPLSPIAGASEISPEEILRKADQARGNVEGIEWRIEIDSVEQGRKQHRILCVKARGYNSLAEFLGPAKVKGQKLLMIDRNMWFIKPGLRKPVPISPRQKLLGGASNGDIASTNYSGDYEITKASRAVSNGEPCRLFDLKATNKSATYDRILYWVSDTRLVGVRAEFFTISGKMFKSAVFEYANHISLGGQQRPFISRMTITNALLKEDVTVMDYKEPEVRPIPDSDFNLNLLVR